jgi:hypothetical protein
VQPVGFPSLAYHVSGHKPASPLIDALKDLHAEQRRSAWLRDAIRIHIWDRGGNGKKVLLWAVERGIPYLTIGGKTVHWTRYRDAVLFTPEGPPVHVRADKDAAAALPEAANSAGSRPCRIIFPAHPQKGTDCTKSLVYPTAASLTEEEMLTLDQVYKQRWPGNENQIKAAIALGFGINRDRQQELTTSRGDDGRLANLAAREADLKRELDALPPAHTAAQKRRQNGRRKKLRKVRAQQTKLRSKPLTKYARTLTSGETLCKVLMLLTLNALTLALHKSALPDLRTMTPAIVRDLLLARPALASFQADDVTLYVEPVSTASQRRLQEALVHLFDGLRLRIRGRTLRLRLNNGSTIQRCQILAA